MMGPAKDDTGFEQGGINSSDYYKLYNNEQLTTAQSTKLGVAILTERYCNKFRVKTIVLFFEKRQIVSETCCKY